MTSILIKKSRAAAKLRELSASDEAKIGGGDNVLSAGCGPCDPGLSYMGDPCPQCPTQGFCGDIC